MIKTNCSKCGAELILHDDYAVCNKCGEIVVLNTPDEEIEEPEAIEEVAAETVEEIVNETELDISEAPEAEEVKEPEEFLESVDDVVDNETETEAEVEEEILSPKMLEFEDAPKKSRAPIVISVIVILCVLVALAGFIISGLYTEEEIKETDETVPVTDVIEEEFIEEPVIEEEIPEIIEETVPEKVEKPAPPAPVVEKKPIKTEEAIITEAPAIAYRIRITADDSTTQIGAFSDLERAKAFAAKHAADGYKVYDMNGNVVFEP